MYKQKIRNKKLRRKHLIKLKIMSAQKQIYAFMLRYERLLNANRGKRTLHCNYCNY